MALNGDQDEDKNEPVVDEVEDEVQDDTEVDETDGEVEAEESNEDSEGDEELSPSVKKILNKNRRETREAVKRAERAERDLAALQSGELSEGENKFRSLYLKTAVKSAIGEAGAAGHSERLLKLVDLDDLEIEDDGTVTGLEDAVDALKEEFEDFFTTRTARKTAPRVNAGTNKPAPKKTETTAERLANRL